MLRVKSASTWSVRFFVIFVSVPENVCVWDLSVHAICVCDLSEHAICVCDFSEHAICVCDLSVHAICVCDLSILAICVCDLSMLAICVWDLSVLAICVWDLSLYAICVLQVGQAHRGFVGTMQRAFSRAESVYEICLCMQYVYMICLDRSSYACSVCITGGTGTRWVCRHHAESFLQGRVSHLVPEGRGQGQTCCG